MVVSAQLGPVQGAQHRHTPPIPHLPRPENHVRMYVCVCIQKSVSIMVWQLRQPYKQENEKN
jgi:hypothetical protein